MTYLIIKSLHLTSMIVWMTAMLSTPFIIRGLVHVQGEHKQTCISLLKKWYQGFGNTGIILTWGLGILLASWGGWMHSGWLAAKIVCVLVLSGLHGFYSAQYRRLENDTTYTPTWVNPILMIQIVLILLIAILVILKPF